MFTTNADTKVTKRMLNDIDPTGIWKGLKLVNFEFVTEKNYIFFELYHAETDSYRREAFFQPQPDASEGKKAYDLSCFEHFVKTFVAPVVDADTNMDVRFGKESLNVDTFEEFCNFYTSKIDLNNTPEFDLKGLYAKNLIMADPNKPYARPRIDRGNMPFVSSKFNPNNLNVTKELNDPKYPKFLSYKIEGMVDVPQPVGDAIDSSFGAVDSQNLPF